MQEYRSHPPPDPERGSILFVVCDRCDVFVAKKLKTPGGKRPF